MSPSPLPVIDLNSAPVAFADIASGPPDIGLKVEALANDMDPDGDTLSLISVDTPVGGTVSIDDNGTPAFKSDDAIFYVPDPGFIGTAVFSYTISDGKNGTASGKITVAIGTNLVKNGFPVAVNDSISTTVDSPVLVPVLGNDHDSDGDAVVITGVSFAANGTVSIDDNGTLADRTDDRVNYSPASGFSGTDSFVYTITDGTTAVSAAVTVEVTPLVPPSGTSSQTIIRGRLVKGPLVGAIVELYVLDDFGFALNSLPVAQAVSDMNGYWQANVPSPRTGLLVVSRGGAYIDEARIQDVARNQYTFFDTVDRLETAIPSTESFAVTSVFTNALLLRARYGATSGGFPTNFESALADATAALGFNPLVNDPANPANPSFTASPASRWHALALGGVSNVINRVSLFYFRAAPDYEMVNAVIRDMADCQLDGRDFSGAISFTLGGVPVAMPTGINLNTEIIRFRNNNAERYSTTAIQTVDNALCAQPLTPVDTTLPVISLLGSNPLNVLLGSLFSDPGVTAFDNLDGNISAAILYSGTVDTTAPGNYLITYSVSDAAGNTATTNRTVTVIDNSVPVIALSGAPTLTIEAGTVYTDVGATASDTEDGDITALVVSASTVNILVPGAYQINYDVTDSDGNAAVTVNRNVTVIDTTPPTLTVVGSAVINITQNDTYIDAGAIALDIVDGDISTGLVVSNPVDTSVPGTYSVTYQITDSSGNAAVTTRTVNVIPNGIPSISLVGSPTVNAEAGSAYTDQGATASDPEDGDLTTAIATTNLVDTNVVGTYVVSYNVVDSIGNAAAQISRTVIVADSVAPEITLSGLATVSVLTGMTYADSGATAFDTFDGDVSGNIITTNPVDTSVIGTYSVLYDVSDAAGNAAIQVTRSVTVSSGDVPQITLLGSSFVTHEAATSYIDAGATASDTQDGDLTSAISVTGTVDVNAPGSYTLAYNVNDSHGNAAVQVTRTVNVTDTSSPVITLAGSPVVTVEAAIAYSEPGFSANDSLDGNISGSVVVTGTVNVFAVGDYVLTYNVNDAAGNAATSISRTVQVRDTTPPVITVLGTTPETVAEDTVYVDAGATANDNLDGDLTSSISMVSTVNTAVPGPYTVTYDVVDAASNNATQATRNVTVTPVNDAPVLIFPMPDDTTGETIAYSNDLSLYFSDEENDSLDYAVTGLPAGTGLALNATTGILSGAANAIDAAASPISLTIVAEDPSLDSAQDTFLLTINQIVDLTLLKTVDDATPNEGQAIVYTIDLSNAGPSAASNIDIQDLQPAGVTFGTATPSAGTFIGNTWNLPTLASGTNATLVINATVDAGTSGSSIVNVAELIAVDQAEVDAADSDSATINVTTGVAVLKTWVGGSNGPAGSETDWNRNGNWSPTGVPNTNDEITIPGTAFDPVLDADLTVSSLRVSAGSNLDIGPHTLTVTGEVRGDSPITGTGLVVVTAGTVRGGLPSLQIDGNVKVVNNLTVDGDLTVLGTFNAPTSVVVNGNLNVTGGTGILLMRTGGSLLIVNGDVLFNGGDHSIPVGDRAPMKRGDMWVTGDFTQSGNPFSFVAEESHRVILDGVGDQTITMMNPDNSNPDPDTPPASGSRFANLYLAKDQSTDGNVILATDIAVLIQLQSSGAYNPRVVSSTGSKMIAGGASFARGTFDNVPVEFVDGGSLNNFRLVTFENMANDVVQLRLRRSETFASSYNFDNLSFMSLPNTVMGGYYIEGENLGGAPITLNIWNSFPGSGEADSNTIGNFTLNW